MYSKNYYDKIVKNYTFFYCKEKTMKIWFFSEPTGASMKDKIKFYLKKFINVSQNQTNCKKHAKNLYFKTKEMPNKPILNANEWFNIKNVAKIECTQFSQTL